MQGWYYGKGLTYYRPIFRLTKLAFLRARVNLYPEKIFRNIRICMGKKPNVSVTYENERISIKKTAHLT